VAEHATETMEIAAPPARVHAAIVDIEAYPSWAKDLKAVSVDSRDDAGRAREATFRAAAMGRSTSYTLRYTYDDHRISWELVRGDITRRLDGSYLLEAVEGDPDRTRVTYDLSVELKIPLPGFVKRRAEGRIVHTALRDLRSHVES
jgi:ribosome-associated toxin RatA of RatAB toxin-antitoxin module